MVTQVISTRQSEAPEAAAATSSVVSRLKFVDNLRILLTALVILQHLAITYGGPGDWYYRDVTGELDTLTNVLFGLFLATNQAFFMGFFFLISSYFTPGAFDRKGGRAFLQDRLRRLGIPLLIYITILNPFIHYLLAVNERGYAGTLLDFIPLYIANRHGLGVGPLWFVATLLIFAGLYALWRRWGGVSVERQQVDGPLPDNRTIAVLAIGLGLVSFVVRIWLPVGWTFELLNLQFPFFPQYIAMLIIGVLAYRGRWLTRLPEAVTQFWLKMVGRLLLIAPVMFGLGGAIEGNLDPFMGGFHWQNLAYAMWEQLIGIALMVGLTGLFRARFNMQGSVGKALAAGSYAAYIIHPLVIISLALILQPLTLYPLFKFALVGAIAVPLCFLVAHLLRQLPLARDIL